MWPAIVGIFAGLSIAVPYVDAPLGLDVDVATRLEVADHVIPGLIVALLALGAVVGRRQPDHRIVVAGTAVAFLAGLWISTTHAPLLVQAGEGSVPWDAALFHAALGPPIAVISLWRLLRQLRALEAA